MATGRIHGKWFAYARDGVDIGGRGPAALAFGHVDQRKVQRTDAIDGQMRKMGQAIAGPKVCAEQFARFPAAA
jgi:hypothetical protein